MGRTKNTNENHLPPEYKRAFNIISKNFYSLKNNPQVFISRDILQTNGVQLVHGNITNKDFPKGCFWRWNQTKSRRFAIMDNGKYSVQFAKFTPRRSTKKCTKEFPSLKLWHFEVNSIDSSIPYHVLWCEKGFKTIPPAD